MLTIRNLSKSFKEHRVLDGIDLQIHPNQIIGLAGPSGSGKSTLLRCIQGLETYEAGEIHCSARTGFMFQDFQLFPHMNVWKNLIYAPTLENKNVDHSSHAEMLLTRLGIFDKAEAYPSQLSGGQKQRVALARSLMMSPELLLCDEPTSGLDIATTQDVASLLRSVQDMGITMLIASHDLDFLIQLVDQIVLLKGGQIMVVVDPTKSNPVAQLKEYY